MEEESIAHGVRKVMVSPEGNRHLKLITFNKDLIPIVIMLTKENVRCNENV